MDDAYVMAKGIRSTVVTKATLSKFKRRDGLILGIVREAEVSSSKACSLINIETGVDKNILLLMKNNAGFLLGRLVIYDQHSKSVSLVENDSFNFRVIARFKPRLVKPASLVREIECPECLRNIALGELPGHLKRHHWFPQTIDADVVPDRVQRSSPELHFLRCTRIETAPLQRICPNPSRWNEVFAQLDRYADVNVCKPSRPPTPLVLAGWASSNDTEKKTRWQETVNWASTNGCVNIVEGILDSDFYRVAAPTTYSIGPTGGPCYRPWDVEAKVRPSDEDLASHLRTLSARWSEMAGPDLSVTLPLRFTGRKARRLLVQAESEAVPPWGGWLHRDADIVRRRTFTAFRAAVNDAISPHDVDHIDFVGETIRK